MNAAHLFTGWKKQAVVRKTMRLAVPVPLKRQAKPLMQRRLSAMWLRTSALGEGI